WPIGVHLSPPDSGQRFSYDLNEHLSARTADDAFLSWASVPRSLRQFCVLNVGRYVLRWLGYLERRTESVIA
ncbi:MAG: hypothetical protein OEW09_14420, partial [Anaerolineae bacterium]|nr:hypothetical protein [Anaerolineae bacterium]